MKKERALLGMMNKIAIVLQLPDKFDESIFKLGIEKLSGPKSSLSDNDFIIYQLISFVPPAFWEKQFDASPAQVVEYFEKYAASLVPALGLAVSRFREISWIPYFLHQEGFYIDFIYLLPAPEQEKYLLRFLDKDHKNITHHSLGYIDQWGLTFSFSDLSRKTNKDTIHYALSSNNEWGLAFATSALTYMANNSYQYNRVFFNQAIKLIPIGVLNQIEKIESKEPNMQSAWEKNKSHLIRLLTLKQQTLQAFNP